MRVSFVTFGCRLNRAETLDSMARYAAAGWENSDESPDLIEIRGCSVTAKAQRDCEKKIARLRELHPQAKIRIVGCLPGAERDEPPPSGGDAVPMSDSRAHLKVQDGCSGRCAFCIVPQFRGAPVSVPFSVVREKALRLLDAGFHEIVLTGCNLCLYRSEGRGLPELAADLAGLAGDRAHRIRLGSIEPGICDSRLTEALAAHENICRHLHISLQSGSDRVLKLMRRPYTSDTVRELRRAVAALPGRRVAMGADVIAGFPGESDGDFAATCAFLAGDDGCAPFTGLHVFPYSERPGTAAATLPGTVPRSVRIARADALDKIGADGRNAFAAGLIGKTVEVCVEKDGNGRTSEYLRCILQGAGKRRELVQAVVADYSPTTGELSATIHA
jgi:threonylcarbamoyladenosine tRNA methylthiotransferase MtaB